ncbi:hypothetical protein [Streptomyces sp. NPDC050738]|uniref:hypothetical protein n=1 Tax=Streptomyces sp. NPDC050738 TaxID=3154744 RepID=UPI003447D02A
MYRTLYSLLAAAVRDGLIPANVLRAPPGVRTRGPRALVFGTSTGKPLRASNRSKLFNRTRRAVG